MWHEHLLFVMQLILVKKTFALINKANLDPNNLSNFGTMSIRKNIAKFLEFYRQDYNRFFETLVKNNLSV